MSTLGGPPTNSPPPSQADNQSSKKKKKPNKKKKKSNEAGVPLTFSFGSPDGAVPVAADTTPFSFLSGGFPASSPSPNKGDKKESAHPAGKARGRKAVKPHHHEVDSEDFSDDEDLELNEHDSHDEDCDCGHDHDHDDDDDYVKEVTLCQMIDHGVKLGEQLGLTDEEISLAWQMSLRPGVFQQMGMLADLMNAGGIQMEAPQCAQQ